MITKRNDLLSKKVIQSLKNRLMNGYYVHSKLEAVDLAFEIMKPGSSVGWGGSDTLNKIGIKEELYKRNFKVIDRDQAKDAEEKYKLERDCFYADYYLMSTNAMTEDGILVNIDGASNRVACIAHGPAHVIFLISMDKLCANVDEAIDRIHTHACPPNALRVKANTPCSKTGVCADC